MSHIRSAFRISMQTQSYKIYRILDLNLLYRQTINLSSYFSNVPGPAPGSESEVERSFPSRHHELNDTLYPLNPVKHDKLTFVSVPKSTGRGRKPILRQVRTSNINTKSNPATFIEKVYTHFAYLFRKIMEPSGERAAHMSSVLLSKAEQDVDPVHGQSLQPPQSVEGMKTLDIDAFNKLVDIPGFRVANVHIGKISNKLKSMFLKIPAIKPIAEVEVNDPEHTTHKVILLDPRKVDNLQSFAKEYEELFLSCDIAMDTVKLYKLQLGYENWTHNEIMRAILPEDLSGVAAYSAIGHILHVNLREDVQDYKNIIGQVLLDKIPAGRTVVNKLDMIDNTFRNFEMEVLAGEDDLVTITKEHGISYKLDFSKVYWNPRLATEHQRIVTILLRSDVVFDVFSGIGPFAVPAAKKGCTVYANDLNPHSYHWLKENMVLNKVKGEHKLYNLDGRQFITTIVKDQLLHHWKQDSRSDKEQYRILMNLPAIAVQFLDSFPGLLSDYSREDYLSWPSYHEPRVYCYAFSKADNGEADVMEQAQTHLGTELGPDHEVRFVRNVAPNKDMFCIMFNLTAKVLFGEGVEPPVKKRKAEMDGS